MFDSRIRIELAKQKAKPKAEKEKRVQFLRIVEALRQREATQLDLKSIRDATSLEKNLVENTTEGRKGIKSLNLTMAKRSD